jgi:hypothetical protein
MATILDLTKEEKDSLLRERNLDPSQYTINADGSISPTLLAQFQPQIPPQQDPILPPTYPSSAVQGGGASDTSFFGAVGRGAAESAVPSLGAILAAAGVGTLGFGPVGTLLGGLGAAFGTGLGLSAIQRKTVPKEIQDSLFLRQQDVEQHPIGSAIGGFVPSTLLFNPVKGISQLGLVGSGVKNLAKRGGTTTSGALTTPQKFALGNILVNEAVEGGVLGAEALFGERDIPTSEIITRLGLAALLSEPTKLGKKIGFPSAKDFSVFSPEAARELVTPPREIAGLLESPEIREARIKREAFEEAKAAAAAGKDLTERPFKRVFVGEEEGPGRVQDLRPEDTTPEAIAKAVQDFNKNKDLAKQLSDIKNGTTSPPREGLSLADFDRSSPNRARLLSPVIPKTMRDEINKSIGITIESALKTIRDTTQTKFKVLIDKLLKVIPDSRLAVRVKSVSPIGIHYSVAGDYIHVGSSYDQVHVSDIIHEILHALIFPRTSEISQVRLKNGAQYLDELKNIHDNLVDTSPLKRLIRSYFTTLDTMGLSSSSIQYIYGVSKGLDLIPYLAVNLDEFISEAFSNIVVQRLLRKLPSSSDPKRSIWQDFLEAIRVALGLGEDVPLSLLDDVLSDSAELFAKESAKVTRGGPPPPPPPREATPIGIKDISSEVPTIPSRESPEIQPVVSPEEAPSPRRSAEALAPTPTPREVPTPKETITPTPKEEATPRVETPPKEAQVKPKDVETSPQKERVKTEIVEKLRALAKDTGKLTEIKDLPEDLAKDILQHGIDSARDRGFKVEISDYVYDPKTGGILRGSKGKPILGLFNEKTRTISLSSKALGPDTIFHETAHGFLGDLLSSSNKRDIITVKRGLEIFARDATEKQAVADIIKFAEAGKHREALELLGEHKRLEEAFVEVISGESLIRALNKFGNPSLKVKAREWYRDVLNRAKNAFNLQSPEEALRFFAARQELDVPFGSRMDLFTGKKTKIADVVSEKEEVVLEKEEILPEKEIIDDGPPEGQRDISKEDETTFKDTVGKEPDLFEGQEKGKSIFDAVGKSKNFFEGKSSRESLLSDIIEPKDSPIPKAFWLTPEGNVVKVRGYDSDSFGNASKEHEFVAQTILNKLNRVTARLPEKKGPIDNIANTMSGDLFRKGFMRGIVSTAGVIHINGTKDLTRAQRIFSEDIFFNSNKRIKFNNKDLFEGQPDITKTSEESRLLSDNKQVRDFDTQEPPSRELPSEEPLLEKLIDKTGNVPGGFFITPGGNVIKVRSEAMGFSGGLHDDMATKIVDALKLQVTLGVNRETAFHTPEVDTVLANGFLRGVKVGNILELEGLPRKISKAQKIFLEDQVFSEGRKVLLNNKEYISRESLESRESLFDDLIVSKEKIADRVIPGAFWLSPDGEVLKVRSNAETFTRGGKEHDTIAGVIAERLGFVSDEIESFDKIMKNNFVRGIFERGKIFLQGQDLTKAQKEFAEKQVFDLNRKVLHNRKQLFNEDEMLSRESLFSDDLHAESPIKHNFKTTQQAASNIVANRNNSQALKDNKSWFLRFLGSAIDKLDQKGDPLSRYVANKLFKHADERSLLYGRYRNSAQEIIIQVNKASREKIDKYGREMHLKKRSSIILNTEEKKVYGQLREFLVKVADENLARDIKKDPNYWPPILSMEAAKEWTQNPGGVLSKRFDDLWLAHAEKMRPNTSDKELLKLLSDYKEALGGDSTSIEFGALRRVAGIGLPEELQVQNLLQRFTRYGERVAKDMAWLKHVQRDPIMRKALNVKDEAGHVPDDVKLDGNDVISIAGTEEVKNIKKFIFNDFKEVHQPRLRSAQRLVNSALLGFGTGVRNLIQIPLNTSPNVGLRNINAYFKALPLLRKAWKESFLYNARQLKSNDLEFGSSSTADVWADSFNKLADGLRWGQLRELSEQFERAYEFSIGKVVAFQEIGRALRGDKHAKAWVEKFGNTLDLQTDIFSKRRMADISEDSINKLAKSFTDRSGGTYDERGLPAGTMEGALAPFFALSRWSIERSNIVYKDVVIPALNGDIGPLLSYTLGAYFTGTVIREISSLLANSAPPEPTPGEVAISEKKDPVQMARAVIAVMQLGSYGGIVSDMMKSAADVSTGHLPTGGPVGFPMIDFVSETLAKGTADYVSALRAGESKLDATLAFSIWTLIRSVQTVRLIANNTSMPGLTQLASADVQERKKLFRDIRIFRELEGETVSADIPSPNPFIDRDVKEFKRTADLGKAVDLAPSLIKKTIDKHIDDPETLIKKFQGLKQIPTAYFPSPEDSPVKFIKFLEFLQRRDGEEVAGKRLVQFLQEREINRAKRALVPSF